MDRQTGIDVDEMFQLYAKQARALAQEEMADGKATTDFIVLIADCTDPDALKLVKSLIPESFFGGMDLSELPGGTLCATLDREVIDFLIDTFPQWSKEFADPLDEGSVRTIVMAKGCASVFHLFMVPVLEEVADELDSEAAAKADRLFATHKWRLVRLALDALGRGREMEDIVAVLFNLDDPLSNGVFRMFRPGLELDASAPAGVGCGMTDIATARRLAAEAPGFEEAFQLETPQGEIPVFVATAGHIIAYSINIFESGVQTGQPN